MLFFSELAKCPQESLNSFKFIIYSVKIGMKTSSKPILENHKIVWKALSLALMQWQKIYPTISPGKNLAHLGSNSKQMNVRCQSFISRLRPHISSAVESSVLFSFAKIFLKWTSPVDLHNLQQHKTTPAVALYVFFSASEDLSHSIWPAKHEPRSRITRFVYW